jgi:tRNA modification GTPase
MSELSLEEIEQKIEWDRLAIVLSDTAGLRKTKNIVEKEGARRSRRASEQADLVLWVVDASHGLTKEDRTIAASLKNKSVVAVLNKTDRGQKIKPAALPIKMVGAVETSATKATGLANLKKAVLKAAWSSFSGPRKDGEVAVTALRHVAHLEKAAGHIGGALAAVKAGRSEEVLSVFVREALNEIGMITGESVTDDVLSAIFRQFCVGK